MADYLRLADLALAEFEAERSCEKSELSEKRGGQQDGAMPGQHFVLLAVPDGVPPEWFEGVRRLVTRPRPDSIPPEHWAQIRDDAWRLLRDHGTEASRLGWGVLDLFGCHPKMPLARHDCAGLALILHGRNLLDIDDVAARIAGTDPPLVYRRRPRQDAVLLWGL